MFNVSIELRLNRSSFATTITSPGCGVTPFAAKRKAGGHIGGHAPFGFRVEGSGKNAALVPIAEQQAAIETMKSLAGSMSLRAIADEVRKRHGVAISHVAVKKVLNRGN